MVIASGASGKSVGEQAHAGGDDLGMVATPAFA
jgi:hypothetical protein